MGKRLKLKGVILGEKWGLDEYRPGTRRERAPGDVLPLMAYIWMCCWMRYGLCPLRPKQGNIILCDSVLHRVHNFVRLCPNYSLDEICSYSKYLKAMTITQFLLYYV